MQLQSFYNGKNIWSYFLHQNTQFSRSLLPLQSYNFFLKPLSPALFCNQYSLHKCNDWVYYHTQRKYCYDCNKVFFQQDHTLWNCFLVDEDYCRITGLKYTIIMQFYFVLLWYCYFLCMLMAIIWPIHFKFISAILSGPFL